MKPNGYVVIILFGLVFAVVARVVFLVVKCGTMDSGKGVKDAFFSGNCDDIKGGGKNKCKQKKRRNKKY
jgi:hypothetical protein